jgi:5-methylcytosine-specific restriction endonuclease McrA
MTSEYQTYLRSEHWQTMRRLALEYAENSCQLCCSPSPLHVHHRSYERLGREKLSDLIVLCEGCHRRFHDVMQKPESPSGWTEIAHSLMGG